MSPIQVHDVNITLSPSFCNNASCPNCCKSTPDTPENIMPQFPVDAKVHDVAINAMPPNSTPEQLRRQVGVSHRRGHSDEHNKHAHRHHHRHRHNEHVSPPRVPAPDVTLEVQSKKCCIIM